MSANSENTNITQTTNQTNSGTKVKIEAAVLIVLLITAVALGIPAYQSYMQLEKAIAVFQQGDECLHKNDIEGAKAKFEECIKIDPELRGAYEELAAIALFEDKDIDKACKIYDQAVAVMPNNADLYVSYSQMMFTVQNYEKARDLAKKAVEIDSGNTMAASHLDLFERMLKDPEMRKNHQDLINKHGNKASLMPGAHHHDNSEAEKANQQNPTQASQAESANPQNAAQASQAETPAASAQTPAAQQAPPAQ